MTVRDRTWIVTTLALSCCSQTARAEFGVPPVTKNYSLGGTPYTENVKPAPAKKPILKYRNGKLVEDSTPPKLLVESEFGDQNNGRLIVPAFLGDVSYMGVTVQTQAGTPQAGKPVLITSKIGNQSLLMSDSTDSNGYLEFRMLATTVGRDTVVVAADGIETQFVLDVTQPPSGEWLGKLDLKGVTPWDTLMRANLTMGRDQVQATYPAEVLKLRGGMVRLVGFMLPLESSARQKHFLLSANPPACFFHPPGGPSSVAEVFVDKGIETSFDPLVLEGRLELVETSPTGILYRLRSARVVGKG